MKPGRQRDRLTLALTDTLVSRKLSNEEARTAMGGLLADLVTAASLDLRISVAARIADVDWAPRTLALQLALDEIDVAKPIIASCQALLEEDLLMIAAQGGPSHRLSLAERPFVTGAVCEAIAQAREPEAMVALLRNATAQMTRQALTLCVAAAQDFAVIREPLTDREDLTSELVEAVYLMVSEELRAKIVARYDVDEASLRRVISAAAEAGMDRSTEDPEHGEAETAALITALAETGALTADFIARSVAEGRPDIYLHAVAKLSDLDLETLRATLSKHGAWAVALGCRACDIRRQSVISICQVLARAGVIDREPSSPAERTIANTYVSQTPVTAIDALRRIVQAD